MPYPGVKDKPNADELRRLYEQEGLSMAAIGEQYGVSGTSVRRWLKDAGIERRPAGWEPGRPRKAEGGSQEAAERPFLRLAEAEREIVLRHVDEYLVWVERRNARHQQQQSRGARHEDSCYL